MNIIKSMQLKAAIYFVKNAKKNSKALKISEKILVARNNDSLDTAFDSKRSTLERNRALMKSAFLALLLKKIDTIKNNQLQTDPESEALHAGEFAKQKQSPMEANSEIVLQKQRLTNNRLNGQMSPGNGLLADNETDPTTESELSFLRQIKQVKVKVENASEEKAVANKSKLDKKLNN